MKTFALGLGSFAPAPNAHHARVLEEPPDDRLDADVAPLSPGTPGREAADAAHDKLDFHAFVGGSGRARR